MSLTCYSVIGHPPNDLVKSHSNAEDDSSNNVTAEGDTDNSRVNTMENAEEPTTIHIFRVINLTGRKVIRHFSNF